MYTTNKIFRLSLSLLALAALFATACNRSTETEQEVITTIEVHLTGANFEHKYRYNMWQ